MIEYYQAKSFENVELDVVVPTHGRLDLTMRCIDALYYHTQKPFHLIVVDDSDPEKDLTPQYFDRLRGEKANLTVLHSDKPYRCGNQIFNLALSHAVTPYMATVMNSVRVEPDWEIVALDFMNTNAKIGVVGLKSMYDDGRIESAGIRMNGPTPVDRGEGEPGHRRASAYPCTAVQWAFAMVRVKAAIGNLDEDCYNGFVGWDDIDNCFAMRHAGWEVWYCGAGSAYHASRATRGRNDDEGFKLNAQNAEIFWRRWGYWDLWVKQHPETPVFYDDQKHPLIHQFGPVLEKEKVTA